MGYCNILNRANSGMGRATGGASLTNKVRTHLRICEWVYLSRSERNRSSTPPREKPMCLAIRALLRTFDEKKDHFPKEKRPHSYAPLCSAAQHPAHLDQSGRLPWSYTPSRIVVGALRRLEADVMNPAEDDVRVVA